MKKKYIVCEALDYDAFQSIVIGAMDDGYELVGGVSVTITPASNGLGATYGKTTYYQSMVLKEE